MMGSLGLFVAILALFYAVNGQIIKHAKFPPWNNKKEPLKVKIGMYMESIGKFQSNDMTFDVDLYLYMSWTDPSMNHTNQDYILINDPKIRKHIWLPDLYFANARTAFFHDVTVPNFNLFVAQDGTIAYSSRVTLTVACNLKLVQYPMDHQECFIRVLSYAYIANQVNVTWFNLEPIRYNPEIELPEFYIKNMSAKYCDGTYMYAITDHSHKIDKFSCLESTISLSRSVGYHLVQSYIPTALIVVISWVSFWIDRRAVPARVTLSFTALLSLSTLGNGLRFGLPMVSYAKSIDYWFGTCMIFVFCALLEFAIVNSYMRQATKYEKLARALEKRYASIESDDGNGEVDENGPYIPSNEKYSNSYIHINIDDSEKMKSENETPYRNQVNGLLSTGIHHNTDPNLQSHTVRTVYITPPINHQSDHNYNKNDYEKHHSISSEPSTLRKQSSTTKNIVDDMTPCISDDDWQAPSTMSRTPVRRRRPRNCRPPNTYGARQYIQLGFLYSRKALRIDKLSRVTFPFVFIVFNIAYWTYYMWYVPNFMLPL